MKLATKVKLNDLDGKPLKDGDKFYTVGKVLANILVTAESEEKVKCFELALKANKEEELTLDSSDKELIKNVVRTTKLFNILITGQLLIILQDLK